MEQFKSVKFQKSSIPVKSAKFRLLILYTYFQLIQSRVENDSPVSLARTSETAFLPDSFDPVIIRLTYRSAHITKLNVNASTDESEMLQVILLNEIYV